MTTYVGGLRDRLIHDSLFLMVRDSLTALGWFDPSADYQPITLVPEMLEPNEPIQLNTIAVSASNAGDSDAEMGSNLSENRITYYVDIYAEAEALGAHLKGDVRDILRGKMPSIGRTAPAVAVMDLTQAVPTQIFTCEIENLVIDRAPTFTQPWQRFWWVIRFELVDTYGDEDDV